MVQIETSEKQGFRPLGVISAIWSELSGGVGPWGAVRPLFAVALSLVPFLFLGDDVAHTPSIAAFSVAAKARLSQGESVKSRWHGNDWVGNVFLRIGI